jgi:hypothetical protein
LANWKICLVGKPTPFSFTRVQVNGWERTATSHGGFIIRKSEDPNDLLILNSIARISPAP